MQACGTNLCRIGTLRHSDVSGLLDDCTKMKMPTLATMANAGTLHPEPLEKLTGRLELCFRHDSDTVAVVRLHEHFLGRKPFARVCRS